MIKLLVVTLFCVAVINAQEPADRIIDMMANAAKRGAGMAISFIPGMSGMSGPVRRMAEQGPPMRQPKGPPPPPEQE